MRATRREFVKLLGFGGAVFASGLPGCAAPASSGYKPSGSEPDFYFVQLSDTHWGYQGPANPEADVTLPQAIEAVNALPRPPDFVVFTGDLTHDTKDAAERRRRLAGFERLARGLKTPALHFLPGEHDAAADRGEAFRERFPAAPRSFDHKGVHFVLLDNVSDPAGALGEAQIDWLARDLRPLPREAPVVVFAHRPLFDLAAAWDWTTKDGSKAIDLLLGYPNATVFYGHIHQEHHHTTAGLAHHAAQSLIFPLPAPLSQPKRAPLPWDPQHPRRGLGFRQIARTDGRVTFEERSVERAAG